MGVPDGKPIALPIAEVEKVMGQALKEPTRPTASLYCSDGLTREMARLTLDAEGYDVLSAMEAPSDSDAFDADLTTRPGLLVMDESALVLVRERPSIPTIVLMSMASPMDAQDASALAEAQRPGSVPTFYLPAPFSPMELSRAAQRLRRMTRHRPHLAPAPGILASRASA
ncbi:MAG: hypothetical protein U0166_01560 [Acidobacteriota bacterium]